MLGDRYRYDGEPIIQLNELQRVTRAAVEEKLRSGVYAIERVACVLCGHDECEVLAEKDRYGLRVSTGICRMCGLIQMNPRMTRESVAAFYEHEYRPLYVGAPVPTERFFERQMRHGRAILEYISSVEPHEAGSVAGRIVAEVGCGAGGILQAFREVGDEVVGVDLGSAYLEYGRGRGLDLRHGDISAISDIRGRIDLLVYSHSLEHTLDPIGELVSAREMLSETGIVYVEVPGVKALTHSYQQDFLRSLQNAHTYYFTARTLAACARVAGLEPVVIDEEIRGVFRRGPVGRVPDSDYEEVMAFLRSMERVRTQRWNKHVILGRARRFLVNFFDRLGILRRARACYYRIKRKKRP